MRDMGEILQRQGRWACGTGQGELADNETGTETGRILRIFLPAGGHGRPGKAVVEPIDVGKRKLA
jgi:hypothetical protein